MLIGAVESMMNNSRTLCNFSHSNSQSHNASLVSSSASSSPTERCSHSPQDKVDNCVKYYQHSTLPVVLWSPSLSPMAYHNLCLQAVSSRYNSVIGVILEQGIYEFTVDLPQKEEHEYSAEEVYRLRYMIITERRNAYLDIITNSIIGKKDGSTVAIYCDAHARVVNLIPKRVKTALKKPPGEAIDMLYAITKNLETYNHWLYKEDSKGIQRVLTVLGNAWKKMLAFPAEVIELDDEFCRPAINVLLRKLQYLAHNTGKLKFNWK